MVVEKLYFWILKDRNTNMKESESITFARDAVKNIHFLKFKNIFNHIADLRVIKV